MTSIRVLIVDDSVVARRAITSALVQHAQISVVGTAGTGKLALTQLCQLAPDAVILSAQMPDADGVSTLLSIRAAYPALPIVMFNASADEGAAATVAALSAGADDFVLKPVASAGESMADVVSAQIVPKLCALVPGRFRRESRPEPRRAPEAVQPTAPAPRAARPSLVVVAASTGGPSALAQVVPTLSRDLSVPVLVVQHLPAVFTACLAQRLDALGPLCVVESAGDELLSAGTVYLAPGDRHLEVVSADGGFFTKLSSEAADSANRPSADVLFRSAARAVGAGVLGVVLTGAGRDGLGGARAIVDAGGAVIAQSQSTCAVWGMPRAVQEAGLCSEVVGLGDIAGAVERRLLLAPLDRTGSS